MVNVFISSKEVYSANFLWPCSRMFIWGGFFGDSYIQGLCSLHWLSNAALLNHYFFNMFSQLVFSTISILLVIVSASSDSDPLWPSADLFNSELHTNQAAAAGLSSNQDLLPLDQTASLFPTTPLSEDSNLFSLADGSSGSLFSANTDDNNIATSSGEIGSSFNGLNLISANNDALISDNSLFDLADCSTSSTPPFPEIGKISRLKRRQTTSDSCKIPTRGAADIPSSSSGQTLDPAKVEEFNELMKDPETRQLLDNAKADPNHNPYCHLLTAGLLPWGVCSSGNPDDEVLASDQLVFPGYVNPLLLFQLTHCTLGEPSPPLFFLFLTLFLFVSFPFLFCLPWRERKS